MDETTTQPLNDTPDITPDEAQQTPQTTTDPIQQTQDLAAKYAEQSLVEDDPLNPEPTTSTETTDPGVPVNQPETQSQTPDQASPELTSSEEEEADTTPDLQAPSLKPLDYTKFVDENGMLDVKALGEAVNQQLGNAVQTATVKARNEYNAQIRETREWNKAVEKYPELGKNKALRDMVENARIGNATEQYQRAAANPELLSKIRVPSPLQIAKTIFDFAGATKEEAIKQVTENVKIQETAYVETADTSHTESKNEQLYKKIGDPRDPIGAQAAQRELLKSLVFKD